MVLIIYIWVVIWTELEKDIHERCKSYLTWSNRFDSLDCFVDMPKFLIQQDTESKSEK